MCCVDDDYGDDDFGCDNDDGGHSRRCDSFDGVVDADRIGPLGRAMSLW